jgi:hypothetical protein
MQEARTAKRMANASIGLFERIRSRAETWIW